MFMPNSSLKTQVKELQAELRALRAHKNAARPQHFPIGGFKTNPHPICVVALKKAQQRRLQNHQQHRLARVTIARGVALTTRPGSLYAAIGKALGQLGHLDRHDSLFNAFNRERTPAGAHRLLQQISVPRDEMENFARADEEFKDHCDDRTIEYKAKAAKGIKKYQKILQDPAICDARGNWRGDFNEALCILSGARSIRQVKCGKNLQILNRAKLMFDSFMIGEMQFCVMYKQKWHRQFRHALALVNS